MLVIIVYDTITVDIRILDITRIKRSELSGTSQNFFFRLEQSFSDKPSSLTYAVSYLLQVWISSRSFRSFEYFIAGKREHTTYKIIKVFV